MAPSRNARGLLLDLGAPQGAGGPVPSGPSTPTNLPPGSLFSDAATIQDVDGGVVLPGDDGEWVTFGVVEEMDGAEKFTKVWDVGWEGPSGAEDQDMAGRWAPTGDNRQWLVRMNAGGSLQVYISSDGLSQANKETISSAIPEDGSRVKWAVVFDGTLGGFRLKVFRDIGGGWEDFGWDTESGAMPSSIVNLSSGAGDERLGNSETSGESLNATVYTHASVIGQAYTVEDLEAMDWNDGLSLLDWDRVYYFNDNLGDQADNTPGVFET